MNKDNKILVRVIMALIGVLTIGIGVGLLQMTALGVDPFTSFVTGIGNIIGLSYGKLYPILTGILIVVIFLIDRRLLGIVTFLNMLLVGPVADGSREFFLNLMANRSTISRYVLFFISLIVIGLGVSLCNNSDLGTGPYDTLQLIMTDKIAGMSFKKSRIICDLISLLGGFIGKAKLGIGTVITALFMGPIIEFFDKHVSSKFYTRKVYN